MLHGTAFITPRPLGAGQGWRSAVGKGRINMVLLKAILICVLAVVFLAAIGVALDVE